MHIEHKSTADYFLRKICINEILNLERKEAAKFNQNCFLYKYYADLLSGFLTEEFSFRNIKVSYYFSNRKTPLFIVISEFKNSNS